MTAEPACLSHADIVEIFGPSMPLTAWEWLSNGCDGLTSREEIVQGLKRFTAVAEPDALRLVPVCHEIALSNHMKVTLEYDPDGSRTAILWNEANEPIAEGDAPVLAAAPAVQPAAGRELVERVLLDPANGNDLATVLHSDPAHAIIAASRIASRILAALAHPPAKGPATGSESGGERPVHRVTWVDDAKNPNDRRLYVDGSQWAKVYGWDKASLDARCAILEAALSQPGPASEGEA